MNYTATELRQWIEARAIQKGDCWVWTLACAHGTQPQGTFKGKTVNVRRAILQLRRGTPMPVNCFAVCSCRTVACVRPEHIVPKSRSASQKGKRLSASHKAAIASARRVNAKVTNETVAEIRDSSDSTKALARRFGISKDYVNQLRSHVAWKDHMSPFAQLGARL